MDATHKGDNRMERQIEKSIPVYFWQKRERNPNGGRWVKRYYNWQLLNHGVEELKTLHTYVYVNLDSFPTHNPVTRMPLIKIQGEVVTW